MKPLDQFLDRVRQSPPSLKELQKHYQDAKDNPTSINDPKVVEYLRYPQVDSFAHR